MSKQFLVWSNQHNAWWRPHRMGYTTERIVAGKYSEEEAHQICVNAGLWKKSVPNEDKVACEPFDWGFEWAEQGPKLLAALKDARDAIRHVKDDNGESVLGMAGDEMGILWPIVDELLCKIDGAIRDAEAIGSEER